MFKDVDITPAFRSIWRWATCDYDWSSPATWAKAGVLGIIWLVVVLWGIVRLVELIARLKKAYLGMGLPAPWRTAQDKLAIRRRGQFAGVLRSDLAVLAKAENWNDQFFTDLEAEVEIEGGYYASVLAKLLRRKRTGLRRVPSLMNAIESSAEQSLLLVGEPGSGKSVALRHLAHQLADRAVKSSDSSIPIPLYVNLRELQRPTGSPDADFIKAFVLDNTRRGDADTAEYVREKWDEYRTRGVWFFLFDSFDEIPAVMHAPTGSPIIREYAEAIRQFLQGMSSCRGILASREYKGPDALPWQRLRVLPMSDEKQDELVQNSFLALEQKQTVRQHLASSRSSLRHNPLFLTLLCRYVKEVNRAPVNDHDLLGRHIDRLANRDPEYTLKKYGLRPHQLLEGAQNLALLFARSTALSLAPTHSEIAAAMQKTRIPGGDLSNLLAALVDVKIGRADVQDAKRGDRRFAFSHRRYQETLFVRYIAEHPGYLSAEQLLTDRRLREYTVTLLQTEDATVIAPLLHEAAKMLLSFAASQQSEEVPAVYGMEGRYYEWKLEPVHLLTLLQEGLGRRVEDAPGELRDAIRVFLEPRWQLADAYDRAMVVSLGGLLPEPLLCDYLGTAVDAGLGAVRDAAFQTALLLRQVPTSLAHWVRNRLALEVILAKSRGELLGLEALAARLPASLGAKLVYRRCLRLRSIGRMAFLWQFATIVARFANTVSRVLGPGKSRVVRSRWVAFAFPTAVQFQFVLALAFSVRSPKLDHKWSAPRTILTIGALAYAIMMIWAGILMAFRAHGTRLSLRTIVSGLQQRLMRLPVAVLGASGAISGLCHLLAFLLGKRDWTWQWYVLVPAAALAVSSAAGVSIGFRDHILWMRENRRISQFLRGCSIKAIMEARSAHELLTWLTTGRNRLVLCPTVSRSFLCLASHVMDDRDSDHMHCAIAALREGSKGHDALRSVADILLEDLLDRHKDAEQCAPEMLQPAQRRADASCEAMTTELPNVGPVS